jgi:two-component system, chemotaxis family, protein-glutamate methylesterase/glutaminase
VAVQDIIVVGASAGGVEALQELVSGLPAEIPAAIFVVLHLGSGESQLPSILSDAGTLPATSAFDGQPIEKGVIYVAPPDHHLLIEGDHVHLSRGPKENRTRPAINPLFRSAAVAYGPRVAGVILTGLLDDGVSGLWEIKRRGGVAIAQDPKEALYPSMPYNATEHVPLDYVLQVSEIPAVLHKLALNGRKGEEAQEEPLQSTDLKITCPECRGPLQEEQKGKIVEYRCRVGHAYSQLSLADDHQETEERALWAAVVALEAGADIAERMQRGGAGEADVKRKREQAEAIRDMLNGSKST